MTADHSGANKHWMNQRNLMRASIQNHRVYLYIRNNHRYIIVQHMSKGRVALQVKTRRTSKHLTNAFGRKSLSFFPLGHSRSRSRYWTVGLGSRDQSRAQGVQCSLENASLSKSLAPSDGAFGCMVETC